MSPKRKPRKDADDIARDVAQRLRVMGIDAVSGNLFSFGSSVKVFLDRHYRIFQAFPDESETLLTQILSEMEQSHEPHHD